MVMPQADILVLQKSTTTFVVVTFDLDSPQAWTSIFPRAINVGTENTLRLPHPVHYTPAFLPVGAF